MEDISFDCSVQFYRDDRCLTDWVGTKIRWLVISATRQDYIDKHDVESPCCGTQPLETRVAIMTLTWIRLISRSSHFCTEPIKGNIHFSKAVSRTRNGILSLERLRDDCGHDVLLQHMSLAFHDRQVSQRNTSILSGWGHAHPMDFFQAAL